MILIGGRAELLLFDALATLTDRWRFTAGVVDAFSAHTGAFGAIAIVAAFVGSDTQITIDKPTARKGKSVGFVLVPGVALD